MQKDSQPGKWDTSVGGHMSPSETPLETAQRETLEELGFAPSKLTFAYQYIWRTNFESELIRAFVTTHEGPFVPDPDEISEGRFWSRDEIEAALVSDVLTPQFRHEYPRLLEWTGANARPRP